MPMNLQDNIQISSLARNERNDEWVEEIHTEPISSHLIQKAKSAKKIIYEQNARDNMIIELANVPRYKTPVSIMI